LAGISQEKQSSNLALSIHSTKDNVSHESLQQLRRQLKRKRDVYQEKAAI
jgi:hypothetical protein